MPPDTTESQPLSPTAVLQAEYEALRPEWASSLREAGGSLGDVHAVAHRAPGRRLSALCLSGGGIRSATFCLGVMQGLARDGLLKQFDYLSSVSGGGYIASWLSAWLKRDGPSVLETLGKATTDPAAPEPAPISHLRRYSNYLTARTGLLSLDTWTVGVIVVRNMLLNWLVLLPILAAALALPLVALVPWAPTTLTAVESLRGLAIVIGTLAFGLMYGAGALPTAPPWDVRRARAVGLALALTAVTVPLLAPAIVATSASTAWAWTGSLPPWCAAAVPWLPWAVLPPLAGLGVSAAMRRHFNAAPPRAWASESLAIVGAGVVQALLLGAIQTVANAHQDPVAGMPIAVWGAWLMPVLVLGPGLVARGLVVAFVSAADRAEAPPTATTSAGTADPFTRSSDLGEAHREWWARWSAYELSGLVGWILLAGLVFWTPWFVSSAWRTLTSQVTAWLGTLTLGGVLSLIGRSARTPARSDAPHGDLLQRALTFGVPLFAAMLIALLSLATQQAFAALHIGTLSDVGPLQITAPCCLLGAIAVIGLAGPVVSPFVNVNRFSLQALYRNRLVRAYLGATNHARSPSLLTDFDPHDDVRLHELEANRPLPVINLSLNLVAGANLAWQERKAASFTATPLHCGSAIDGIGHRPTRGYGGQDGPTLGAAMATSGAAANPNIGHSASSAAGFLMTLFNARLGSWAPNPAASAAVRDRPGPIATWWYLLCEAFGWTTETSDYVNLSDGGHFENLALYEMVRRRCHHILVCDAEQDGACAFNGLGNAIRKIRADFGIPIVFDRGIDVFAKQDGMPPRGGYWAAGEILYDTVDPGAPNGKLLYVKPAICGDEPYDVVNYARTSTTFPHESTADQWFSEQQFESYRALGSGAFDALRQHAGFTAEGVTFDALHAAVRRYAARARRCR